MEEYQLAIETIKNLDLSKYPTDEIRTAIGKFGKFGIILQTLHRGKALLRARPNEPGKTFTLRNELSYKPPQFNTTYQRASTPSQTMFYAGTIPENLESGELDNARVVAALEASHLLRTVGQEGEQKVTFSRWIVTDNIPMVAICYHKDFVDRHSHTKELHDAFLQAMENLDAPMKDKSIQITEFLAAEFARKDIRADYDYMISALFTEIAVKKDMAGVYYPSIKADAKGFNIAITPAYADKSIRLVAAGECTIYKKGDRTIVDNETVCEIADDTKPFLFSPVKPEFHAGRDNILKELSEY